MACGRPRRQGTTCRQHAHTPGSVLGRSCRNMLVARIHQRQQETQRDHLCCRQRGGVVGDAAWMRSHMAGGGKYEVMRVTGHPTKPAHAEQRQGVGRAKPDRVESMKGELQTYFSGLLGTPREGSEPGMGVRESATAAPAPGSDSRAGRGGPGRDGVCPCMCAFDSDGR